MLNKTDFSSNLGVKKMDDIKGYFQLNCPCANNPMGTTDLKPK